MEEEKKIKTVWNRVIAPLGFWLFLISSIVLFMVYHINTKNLETISTKYDNLSQQMSVTNGALNIQTFKADSMNLILTRISKYMPMASLLQYRDSVCSKLPYKSGDVVLMKPDSSRWVIIAVSLKGGKWQHTVSYILRDSTGKQVEAEPETLY